METQEALKKQCRALKLDRSHCQASALPGADFCFFHDPAKAEERRESQALGGRQNRIKTLGATGSDVKVEDCGDVVALLSQTINQVRKGMIDPRVANSVGYLANVLIKAFEQDELETRIERLEALLERRSEASELTVTGAE
jgi:hypothetical protein